MASEYYKYPMEKIPVGTMASDIEMNELVPDKTVHLSYTLQTPQSLRQ